MGMGGVGYLTGSDTFSSFFNPAGLGYIDRPRFGLAFRNLPTSRSVATGNFNDQDLVSEGEGGSRGLSHIGYATPMGSRGTFGVSLTLGGYLDDTRVGDNLVSGALFVRNYRERIKIRSDFLTLGYGRATADGTMSWGISALYAMFGIKNRQEGELFDSGNNLVGTLDVDNSETATGLGVVAGVMFSPRNSPNMSLGFSYRSEIDLTNNSNTAAIYDKVPARLAGGIALRRDGLRNGNDFLVYGAEVQHFFRGKNSPLADRKEQTVGAIGIEYNYVAGFGRLPIRVGFQGVPAGGRGFGPRNALTYGIGYRPAGSELSIDLNFAKPEGGGADMSLSVSYRFK